MAAAPGANEDDGMQFEGPHQQQEPELGNQYIISSSLIIKIKINMSTDDGPQQPADGLSRHGRADRAQATDDAVADCYRNQVMRKISFQYANCLKICK